MTKSKLGKKIVAVATTAMLLLAMAIPAMAAPGTPEGTITVHKYTGTSISGAVENTTGEQVTVDPAYSPLEGAEFGLYVLPQADIDAINAKVADGKTVTGHTIAKASDGTPTVTFNFSDSTTVASTGTLVDSDTTPASGTIAFGTSTKLADGYYVLVETDTPEGHLESAPSLVKMPLTASDGTANYDIHLYPKNIEDKDVANKIIEGQTTPVQTGDEMTFVLKAKFISASVGSAADLKVGSEYGKAQITESFNSAFKYTASSAVINWIDSNGDILGTPLASSLYTVVDTAAIPGPGGDVVVTLTNPGIDAAIAETGAAGFAMTVKAQYVGGASAAIGDTVASVTNKMTSIMTKPNETDIPTEDEIFAPTVSILVTKTTSDGTTPLDGVTFKLATKAAPLATDFIKGTDGNDLEVTTDATGKLVFSNLNGYVDATGAEYYLIETETKPGYQLKEAIKVTFENKAWYLSNEPDFFDDADDWVENVQLTQSVTVKNYAVDEVDPEGPGFSLPLTGGAGTIMFTVIGIVVMLGATLIYFNSKKKNVQK